MISIRNAFLVALAPVLVAACSSSLPDTSGSGADGGNQGCAGGTGATSSSTSGGGGAAEVPALAEYTIEYGDAGAVRVSVSSVEETPGEDATELVANLHVTSPTGEASYRFDVRAESGSTAPDGQDLVVKITNDNGQTSLVTRLDASAIKTSYVVGKRRREAAFEHLDLIPLAYEEAEILGAEGHGFSRPGALWPEYPLQNIAARTLAALNEKGLTTISSMYLELASTVAAPVLAGMPIDPEAPASEIDSWQDEMSPGTVGVEDRPPAPTEACIIPDQQKAIVLPANATVLGVAGEVRLGSVEVTAMRTASASLRQAASGATQIIEPDPTACLAPSGTDTSGWTKVRSTVEAEAKVWCDAPAGGGCCKNGADDEVTAVHVSLKLGNEGVDIGGSVSPGDATGGVARARGAAWLCFEPGFVSPTFHGAANNIQFSTELY